MIDVCVSTHDNAVELPAVLDSVLAQRASFGGAVRVFDNGSVDGGVEWVRSRRPEVEVVELRRNRGPAASRNAALRGSRADWVLLLDGDCSLAPDFAAALLRERAARPAEVYSARVVYAADPGLIYYDAGAAHFLGLLCLENVRTPVRRAIPPAREPGAVSTSALLVQRDAALRAGLFAEDYFFYGEDLDFSLRLRALGGRLRHVPEAVALHHKPLSGAASGAGGGRPAWRARRQGPNRWRTLIKVCRAGTLARTVPLHLAYGGLEALNSLREGAFGQHLLGVFGFLADLPRLLRERRCVQAARQLEDRGLFADPPLAWRPEVMAIPGAGLLRRVVERACGFFWPAVLALSLSGAGSAAAAPVCLRAADGWAARLT